MTSARVWLELQTPLKLALRGGPVPFTGRQGPAERDMGLGDRFVELERFSGRHLRLSEGGAGSRSRIVCDQVVAPRLDGVGTSVGGFDDDRLIGISNAGVEIRPGAPAETKRRSQQRLIGGGV